MTTKRFLRLQIIIVLMLTFTIITNTFSWAARPAVKGGGFMSETNVDGGTAITNDKTYFTAMELITPANGYYVNGNSCTAVTYMASVDAETDDVVYDNKGKIVYDETKAINNLSLDAFEGESFLHFKTVITNASDVPTNTSLYISLIFPNEVNNKDTSFSIGVTSPITKHSFVYKGKEDLVKPEYEYRPTWCPVLTQVEISEGTEYIEWYIKNETVNTTRFEITDIYFTNY